MSRCPYCGVNTRDFYDLASYLLLVAAKVLGVIGIGLAIWLFAIGTR